jgi:hypothetical protein
MFKAGKALQSPPLKKGDLGGFKVVINIAGPLGISVISLYGVIIYQIKR